MLQRKTGSMAAALILAAIGGVQSIATDSRTSKREPENLGRRSDKNADDEAMAKAEDKRQRKAAKRIANKIKESCI